MSQLKVTVCEWPLLLLWTTTRVPSPISSKFCADRFTEWLWPLPAKVKVTALPALSWASVTVAPPWE